MNDFDLDRLFQTSDADVRAPHGFEERLFARLERETPVYVPAPAQDSMPWWVRVAAERHVALAFVIAGILLLSPTWWLSAVGPARLALTSFFRSAEAGLAPWLLPLSSTPNAGLALALAITPFLAWGSYRLALALERRTARVAFASIRG